MADDQPDRNKPLEDRDAKNAPAEEDGGPAKDNADGGNRERGPHETAESQPELQEAPDAALSQEDLRRQQAEIRKIRAMSGSGDAIGRDQINITVHGSADGEGWQVYTRTESESDVSDHLRSFASTPSRNLLAEVLSRGRIAVLRSRRRSGATTTALAALATFTERIREIGGDRPPASLPEAVIEPGCGYVFDAVGAAWAAHPRDTAVLGCHRLLERRGAWLIVLVDANADMDSVRDLLVEHEPPDPLRVLAAHLKAAFPGESAFVSEVLQTEPPPRTPGEAADLAKAAIRGRRAGRPMSAVMEERPHSLREEARRRLRQNRHDPPEERDLARRAFLIAQAVLPELAATHVCRAAYRLAVQLHEVEKQKTDEKLSQLPFGDMLDNWLDTAPSVTVGNTPDHAAETDRRLPMQEGLAEAILHVVWFDYIVAHEALLRWLRDLADTYSDRRVRFRAALALGRLAVHDFDFMVQTCFVPWSESPRISLHEATAWALEETVKRDPSKLPRVFAAADAWARGRIIGQRSTALWMYGTYLGVRDPNRALRGLRHLVLKDDARLRHRIKVSLVEIFAGGQRRAVVDALADWACSPHPRMRRAAGDCLAELAQLNDPSGAPELMTMFDEQPGPVSRLWRLVLASRLCGHRPWDALRAWHKRGVDMTELRVLLENEPRLRRPLAFYLGPRGARAALPAPSPFAEEATR